MTETYIFDGTEVIKTGRTAERQIKTAQGKIVRTLNLVEIKPLDKDLDWHKWIDPSLLFVIRDST